VAISTIEFAKSQVEWMNNKIVQSFEVGRYNPFDFKHIKLCCSLSELNRIQTPSKNKLVLASTADLQSGFSRNLFAEWCENPKNTIIFTSRTSPDTLAAQLIENLNRKSISLEVSWLFLDIFDFIYIFVIWFQMKKRVELEGVELEEHYRLQYEKEKEKQDRIKKSKELEYLTKYFNIKKVKIQIHVYNLDRLMSLRQVMMMVHLVWSPCLLANMIL
jgi:cleavage and polyadenylation specificity factor subunit 2